MDKSALNDFTSPILPKETIKIVEIVPFELFNYSKKEKQKRIREER